MSRKRTLDLWELKPFKFELPCQDPKVHHLKVTCQHEVQLELELTDGLEVCDLTPCPLCSKLPGQSYPDHLLHVLTDSVRAEDYSQGDPMSYGGTE